jgi:hypothetical protein
LICVGKSTLSGNFGESVAGFVFEFAGAIAVEEFAIAGNFVVSGAAALEVERALVPALMWPHA